MLLTGFSRSIGREVGVEQLLSILASREHIEFSAETDEIPRRWREHIRRDIECPSCFVTGAEVAKLPAAFSGISKRRWCFHFSDKDFPSPHSSDCDFKGSKAGKLPANMVRFDTDRTMIDRGVRELVARAISLDIIDDRAARGLRAWLFDIRKESKFLVTLDPRLPRWIQGLHGSLEVDYDALPYEVVLTKRIVKIPGFDWRTAATVVYRSQYRELLEILDRERLWLHASAGRVESLAGTYHGQYVLDRASIRLEYEKAMRLATFISINCSPINRAPGAKKSSREPTLLAFATLLLFVSGWDLGSAIDRLAVVMSDRSKRSEADALINLTCVNPFDDYEAWDELKRLQALPGFRRDKLNMRVELLEIERQLRAGFS
ncbi:hypothetical protein [Lysobacter antibioticus]|jgi:hypothetical protein|uniref:hypothetical protein n=1 Tax=Lysobacter antibioticus TaxID=84531 RepID=UPI000A4804FB|nr:hypothetical protein [Lysobacter antibioticus]